MSGGHLSAARLLVSMLSTGGAPLSSSSRIMASELQTESRRAKREGDKRRELSKSCFQIRKRSIQKGCFGTKVKPQQVGWATACSLSLNKCSFSTGIIKRSQKSVTFIFAARLLLLVSLIHLVRKQSRNLFFSLFFICAICFNQGSAQVMWLPFPAA